MKSKIFILTSGGEKVKKLEDEMAAFMTGKDIKHVGQSSAAMPLKNKAEDTMIVTTITIFYV